MKVSSLLSLPESGYNFRVELSHCFLPDRICFYFLNLHRHSFKKKTLPVAFGLTGDMQTVGREGQKEFVSESILGSE